MDEKIKNCFYCLSEDITLVYTSNLIDNTSPYAKIKCNFCKVKKEVWSMPDCKKEVIASWNSVKGFRGKNKHG